jgi:N-methylhydantoinase A
MAESSVHRSNPPVRIAIDTGGTFTDCVWVEQGKLRIAKVFSTPQDPSQAIAEALAQVTYSGAIVLLHGTTVGTNTLLQRKGARVAFVTTWGFEDTLEIGRQNRPKLYDLTFERDAPLVDRNMRFGVRERVAPTGEILIKPTADDLRVLARDVHASGATAIAVSTLFSFVNPENEKMVGRVLDELGLPLSLSHSILPEFREYERASTVVINAYLQPVMQSYLQRLEARLREKAPGRSKGPRVFVMQSSGGITSVESASRQPVRTVLSGPAGGVVGAVEMARRSGFERIIAFDMGGTSTDVALVSSNLRPSTEAEIAGFPVRVPMLDIHTVGAGGGSIARFDSGGALRVGPESAGADPGPICYGRGTQPTVTDANLLLGRLQPDKFLGGSFVLDLQRTRKLTTEWLKAQGARLSLQDFAEGVIDVVNASMERALRLVSIERGHDPRQFGLVAFGGAGGLHACDLAKAMAIPRVILPINPGALSAFGILVSDIIKDYSRTVVMDLSNRLTMSTARKEFEVLQSRARREFHEEGWEGPVQFERSADLRYHGQGFEINVDFAPTLLSDFHREHKFRYGFQHSDREAELVTLRLRARVRSPKVTLGATTNHRKSPAQSPKRQAYFHGKLVDALVYDRQELIPGRRLRGPAIVAEFSGTTAIPPGVDFWADRSGNIMVEIQKGKAPG